MVKSEKKNIPNSHGSLNSNIGWNPLQIEENITNIKGKINYGQFAIGSILLKFIIKIYLSILVYMWFPVFCKCCKTNA